MENFKDLYAVLGVAPAAAPEVIRAAYRVLAQRHHPDRQAQSANDDRMMVSLNKAYEVLSCPQRRSQYDQWLSSMQAQFAAEHRRNIDQRSHVVSSRTSSAVLTTYDHRGRLHAYA